MMNFFKIYSPSGRPFDTPLQTTPIKSAAGTRWISPQMRKRFHQHKIPYLRPKPSTKPTSPACGGCCAILYSSHIFCLAQCGPLNFHISLFHRWAPHNAYCAQLIACLLSVLLLWLWHRCSNGWLIIGLNNTLNYTHYRRTVVKCNVERKWCE